MGRHIPSDIRFALPVRYERGKRKPLLKQVTVDGGRLESRYRYSVGIVYNPFPWPEEITDSKRAKIRSLAQAVLDARLQFPTSTLADLYDVDAMPPQLRKAHRALDDAVDKLYRSPAFTGDRDRAEHLFGLYEKLVAPLVVAASQPTPRGRRQTNVW